MAEQAHMVKQTITYSDGTEKVIHYRGVIVNGELTEDAPVKDEPEEVVEEAPSAEETTEEVE